MIEYLLPIGVALFLIWLNRKIVRPPEVKEAYRLDEIRWPRVGFVGDKVVTVVEDELRIVGNRRRRG
ncbi:MAG TPA: hypothetical protein ENG74_01410 [Thermoplasmatales archaeon]|nr:hypothetical protein [Thermoplasmatales archaeon]